MPYRKIQLQTAVPHRVKLFEHGTIDVSVEHDLFAAYACFLSFYERLGAKQQLLPISETTNGYRWPEGTRAFLQSYFDIAP